MIIEIKKCELDDRNIKAVIALSKEWESEDLTYGYCANDKNDLIGSIPKKITSLHIFVISLMLLITNQFFSIGNRINSLLS